MQCKISFTVFGLQECIFELFVLNSHDLVEKKIKWFHSWVRRRLHQSNVSFLRLVPQNLFQYFLLKLSQ